MSSVASLENSLDQISAESIFLKAVELSCLLATLSEPGKLSAVYKGFFMVASVLEMYDQGTI